MNVQILDVYLNDMIVGELRQNPSGGLSFAYCHNYFSNNNNIAISVSLPLQAEPFTGQAVQAYFSGILPDEAVKQKIANYLGLSEKNVFSLLKAIGGECAGALSFYPQGEKPLFKQHDDNEILDDKKLSEILELIKRRPMLAGDDGYRLSLAGAQNKLAVGFVNHKIVLIKNDSPTTHILKPLIEQIEDSVYNEFFCMRLAHLVNIDVPECFLYFNENVPMYVIERYDRYIRSAGTVERIHQEDFCQALSIPPEMKYEREGGVSIKQSQELIIRYTQSPAQDMQKFLNLVMFNYLIGNSDAHGKNFSFLYRGGKPSLSPAYDLLSTAVYPNLSVKMAMKIGGKYDPNEVFLRHWYQIISDTQIARKTFEKQFKQFAHKLKHHAENLKENLKQEGLYAPIYEDIYSVIKRRCDIL